MTKLYTLKGTVEITGPNSDAVDEQLHLLLSEVDELGITLELIDEQELTDLS